MSDVNVVLGRSTDGEAGDRPPFKAIDLGDGTYALAVAMPMAATILAELQAIRALLERIEDNTDGGPPGLNVKVLGNGVL